MINDADFFLEAVFELGFEHGMSENHPFRRRKALDQGTALPASSLLKLNDFRSYRAQILNKGQPLLDP